MRTHPADLVIL